MNKITSHVSAVSLAVVASLSGTVSANTDAPSKEFEGDTIVVSATRSEQSLGDVPASVSVVDASDIEKFVFTDLGNLFKYDPSITATGQSGEAQTLNVRGMGGNRLVYVKDGRRVNDGYAGGGGFLVGRGYFDTDSVAQVEVAKGAASSLYGSDALAGIVVITTKDPSTLLASNDFYADLNIGYDSSNKQLKLGTTVAADLNNWKTSAALTSRKGEETQNFAETIPGFDSDALSILLKTENELTSDSDIKFVFDRYEQTYEQTNSVNLDTTTDKNTSTAISAEYFSSLETSFYDQVRLLGYVSQYEQGSDQSRASISGYTDFNDYRFEQDIWGLQAQFDKTIETSGSNHSLTYGIEFDQYNTERPRYKTRVLADGTVDFTDQQQKAFPGADTDLLGVYVQDQINFSDSPISLIAALRFDSYQMSAKDNALYDGSEFKDVDEQAISPKLAATFKLNNAVNLYAQYMQGFKIPPHDQAYQSHGVEPFYQILPNADLEAEESESIEVGMKINTDDVKVSLAFFDSSFENFINTQIVKTEPTYIPGVNKAFYQYQNIDSVSIDGWELSASYWMNDQWSAKLNLADTRGKNDETGNALTSISPLSGSLLVTHYQDNWQHTLALRAAKAMTDVETNGEGEKTAQSSGYGVLDWYSQVELEQWRVSMGISNLLDKEYVDYQSIAGQSEQATYEQYTQPGRSLSINVNYAF